MMGELHDRALNLSIFRVEDSSSLCNSLSSPFLSTVGLETSLACSVVLSVRFSSLGRVAYVIVKASF